jgi:hypothetical protein
MLHKDDEIAETFKFSLEELFSALLPNNIFLAQKE